MNQIFVGDCLEKLKEISDESVDCIVTSPPYFRQRDYGLPGQVGLEDTVEDYINRLCDVFNECFRIIRSTGSLFVVIGDTYSTASGRARQIELGKSFSETDYSATCKIRDTCVYRKHVYLTKSDFKNDNRVPEKTALLIPERFLIEMQNRGWIVRNKIVWNKTNAIPESVKDRFTNSFEFVYFFTKSQKYFHNTLFESSVTTEWDKTIGGSDGTFGDVQSRRRHRSRTIKSKKRKMRSVWSIPTVSGKSAHTARFPEMLVKRCLDSCRPADGGVVLDPFAGSGTVGTVAEKIGGWNYILIELNPVYIRQTFPETTISNFRNIKKEVQET